MKGMLTGFQTFLVFLSTVAVVFAEETKKEGGASSGYEAIYAIWYILIGIILVWGVYDSFFRPIE
jgi:hypothetical protein